MDSDSNSDTPLPPFENNQSDSTDSTNESNKSQEVERGGLSQRQESLRRMDEGSIGSQENARDHTVRPTPETPESNVERLASRIGVPGAGLSPTSAKSDDPESEGDTAQQTQRAAQVVGHFIHAIAELLGNTAVQVLLVVTLLLFIAFVVTEATNQTVGQNPNSCILGSDCGALSSNCSNEASGTTSPGNGSVSTSGLDSAAGKEVAQAAYGAGFRGDDLIEMTAISYAESGWNPNAGSSPPSPSGLWQEESTEGIPGSWSNPQVNAARALKYWQASGGVDPASGNLLPAPDMYTSATQYITSGPGGQAYLAGTHYAPWYDFAGSAASNYEKGLALANQDISQWIPNWNQGQTPGSGGSTGGSSTGSSSNTGSSQSDGQSCCPGSSGTTTLTGSNIQQEEYNFYLSSGLTPWGAAAIAGDMEGEGSNPFIAEEGYDPHNNTWPDNSPSGSNSDIVAWNTNLGRGPAGWGIVQWSFSREQEVGQYVRSINPDLYQSQYTNQEHKDYGSDGVSQLSSAVGTNLTNQALSAELQFTLIELKKYSASSGGTIYSELTSVNSEAGAMQAVHDLVWNYEDPADTSGQTTLRQGYAKSIYNQYHSDSVASSSGSTTSSTTGNTGSSSDGGCTSLGNTQGIQGIVNLATLIGKTNNSWSGNATSNAPSLQQYQTKAIQVGGPNTLWASCDRSVALVIKNTVDPDIPWGDVTTQYQYFTGAGKSKWELVKNGTIQPGDIANAGNPDSAHTFIYLSNGYIYDGSLGQHVGIYEQGGSYNATKTNAQGQAVGPVSDDGTPFYIFRYIGPSAGGSSNTSTSSTN